MAAKSLTVEAAFQDVWPANAAEIYQELAEEDKRLAETMWPLLQEIWPKE